MTVPRPPLVALLVALLVAGGARADDPGSAGDIGADGAAALVSPAGNALVAIRRSEPRSELAMSVGAAVVDQPANTGPIPGLPERSGLGRGALELEGSWAPGKRWELFATANVLAARWLLVGSQQQGQVALGSTTVGATWVPISLPRGLLDAGGFVRVLLPTSHEVRGALAWGVQAGLTLRGVATPWLAWYGGLSFRVSESWGSVTLPTGPTSANLTLTGGSATAGVAFVPSSWLRVMAQCTGNLPFGRGTDQLSPAVGVRFVAGPLGADLGASIPLLGQTRTFGAMARVSWRLDR